MKPRRYIMTGPSGAGKTTFCRALADQARAAGWDVTGILCPPLFESGIKTGIHAQDLRTGETRPLAISAAQSPIANYHLPLGQWLFSPAALAWGNQILQTAPPCDLLIVDELGPLEFFRGEGWQTALKILPRGEYKAAVVIVRPELLQNAFDLLGKAEVISLPLDPQASVCVIHNIIQKMSSQKPNP